LTVGAVALTGVVGAGVCGGLLPTGAPEWFWRWRAGGVLPWGTAATVAGLAALLMALLTFDRLRAPAQPARRVCALLLVAMIVLGLALSLGVAMQDPVYPVTAGLTVLSDLATGYYTIATRLPGVAEAFSQHVGRAENPAVPDRVRTHPPGPILLMMAVREAGLSALGALAGLEDYLRKSYGVDGETLARLARMGTAQTPSPLDALIAVPIALLLTVLPALVVLPAYGLGAVLADRRVGLAAAVLAATLPSLLCFVPGIDGLGAVIALTVLYLWAAALRRGDWWLYLLAGLGGAAALLWSFGYAALALPALALVLPRGEWRPVRLGQGLIFTAAGLAVVYGVLDAGLGYSLPAAMSVSLAAQKEIMVREHRPYLTWLWLDPYSWVVFLGPGLLLIAVAARFTKGMREGGLGRLTQGLVATLVLLVLAGTTRAEVERIWVFLMPLAALPAAWVLGRFPQALRLWGPALIVLAQVGLALALHGAFDLVKPY
jgi:hypothetical protein